MSGAFLHTLFDIAAWLAAAVAVYWMSRQELRFPAQSFELPYIAALVFGAGLGASSALPRIGATLRPVAKGLVKGMLVAVEGLQRIVAEASAQGYVALDTETDCIDCIIAKLAGISLATAPNTACYIPVGHSGGDLYSETPNQLPQVLLGNGRCTSLSARLQLRPRAP